MVYLLPTRHVGFLSAHCWEEPAAQFAVYFSRCSHFCISAWDNVGPLFMFVWSEVIPSFIWLPHTNHTPESYNLLTLNIYGGNEKKSIRPLESQLVGRDSETSEVA